MQRESVEEMIHSNVPTSHRFRLTTLNLIRRMPRRPSNAAKRS